MLFRSHSTLRRKLPSSKLSLLRASGRSGMQRRFRSLGTLLALQELETLMRHFCPIRRYVLANDLSPAAVEAIKRNVELNDLHEHEASLVSAPTEASETAGGADAHTEHKERHTKKIPAKVQINEGDAWCVVYAELWNGND